MNRNRYLLKNTAIFALGNFGTKFISFLLVPLYTNVLTRSQYGIVDLVYTVSTVLVPLITFSIGESVMRFSLDKNGDHNKIMSVGIFILLFATLFGLLIVPFSKKVSLISDYGVYIYFYCIAQGYSLVLFCYLRGKELLLQYSIGNILQSFLIGAFNILFLVILEKGIEGYFTSYILANTIAAVYAAIVGNVREVIKKFRIEFSIFKEMIRYSVALIPNSLMWWIMNSSDHLMVTSMIGVGANGLYTVAYKIPSLLSVCTTIFNQAWSYSAIKENESKDAREYNNIVYDRMVHMVGIIAAGLMLIMKPFMKIYVSEDFYMAWEYTPFLIIGFVFMTLGSFLSTSYIVNKDSMGFLLSGTCGAIMNIVLNFLLIPVWGVQGAAFATCSSYIAVFLFRAIHTRKYLVLKVANKKHLTIYCMILIMGATMFIKSKWNQLLLLIEFIVLLGIMYRFLIEVFHMIVGGVLKKFIKK